MDSKQIAFQRLLDIMDELREKCPWDKKQTFKSLRHLTIEETFELSEAIVNEDFEEIKKELGDLFLHLVFYSKIASEQKKFDVEDVLNQLCEKLIRRHPHIYGDIKVKNDEEVKQNWEQIKLKEGNKSVLGGVPKVLPNLVKALRMQDKAAQVGFDWPKKELVWEKYHEELQEFIESKNITEKEEEFGDMLFSLVNIARWEGINPDDALENANKKFRNRFEFIEAKAKKMGVSLNEMSLKEMDKLWEEAKGD
ncbi:MAG: nucleoside triphosphate pyrophosphohydrolase [Bacteroidetes bacterium MED-G17]|nr:MAG: nucleoside triphosphate pyrophosphohydrolase [Bacteroidetes bacterium TMED39]PDH53620.1 MAG: nucleoside triphosphate pyrophosphohydrolase [Bacteroidetes bacterium MED-G17]CAI8330693.1 MAG: Nucleoside triphosphate pyrophosphohydrolase [Bacteroidetes bacterium MED-G17]|tara:strand:+ start:14478 stop:15233 length:756 start_codon:yes stop_codon:yes gene_type:complete